MITIAPSNATCALVVLFLRLRRQHYHIPAANPFHLLDITVESSHGNQNVVS